LIFLWKKIILFIIAIFINNIQTRIVIIVLILWVSIQFHDRTKPFLTENLNYTEKNACVSTFLIFLVKSFNFTMEENLYSEFVCMFLVLALQIQFLYICLLNSFMIKMYSYVTKRQKKKKKVNGLIGKLSKSKNFLLNK